MEFNLFLRIQLGWFKEKQSNPMACSDYYTCSLLVDVFLGERNQKTLAYKTKQFIKNSSKQSITPIQSSQIILVQSHNESPSQLHSTKVVLYLLRLGTVIVLVSSGICFVNNPRLHSDQATRLERLPYSLCQRELERQLFEELAKPSLSLSQPLVHRGSRLRLRTMLRSFQ